MVIPSVISSVQGRKAAAARLAVLIIIVQALGLGPAGHKSPLNCDSTRKSGNRKKYSAGGAPMFPAATSRTGGPPTLLIAS